MTKKYPVLKNLAPLFFLLCSIVAFSQTQIFTTSGTFTVPAGVTQLTVEAWGGGGAGGGVNGSKYSAGGGGGGAYTIANSVIVTPGQIIDFTVGSGGIGYLPFNDTPTGNGGNGGNSTFLTVNANGGKGGGGVPNNSTVGFGGVGGIGGTYSGGSGSAGFNANSASGGGGGSSAGTGSNGTNTVAQAGAVAPTGGGNGGNGGASQSVGNNGSLGSVPGGGGGGGSDVNNAFVSRGGAGGNGQVILTWTCPTYSLSSTTVATPICINNGAVVTLNGTATSLPRGTYTVTYNQSAPNLVTGATKTITVTTPGTGSFTTNNLANVGATSITITNLSSGSGTPNCSSAINANNSTSVIVTTAIPATPGAITLPTNKCSGSTGNTFSIAAVSGAISYTWSVTGTGWVVTAGGTTTSATITVGTGVGTVSVTATNGCGTSAASTTGSITPTAIPATPGAITQPTNKCSGSAGNTFSIAALSGAISYTWSVTGTGWVVTAGGTTTSATITVGTGVGTVSVTATNGCGTSAASTTGNVTPIALPETPPTTNASICSGSSATLAASGAITGQTYNWYTASTGGSSINSTNTYNTPAITATTNYWVSIVNSNGCESVRTMVTAFVNVNNIWTGAANDKNWNNPSNWCIGVPVASNLATLDVIIPKDVVMPMPDGSPNYPIIYSGATAGYVKTIVLENNTTLNVRENSLRITDNLTLNGIIDLEGESQLLQDTGSTFNVASTGYIKIDQRGSGNSFRYNYWSSPVNSRGTKFTIDEVLRGGDGTGTITNKNITYGPAYYFAEGDVDSSPIRLSTYWMYLLRNSGLGYSAWFRVGNMGEVLVGEGYTMKGSNTSSTLQNYTFVGTPNNGDITLPLNAGFDYLVGNPYPSALNAAKFLLDNPNTTGTIYFWEHYGGDTHNLAGYQAGYATRNSLAGVPATSAAGVSSLIPPGLIKKIPGPYIAVGQSFFVVGGLANGQIKFNNGQRVFVKESQLDTNGNPISVFMKPSNTKAKNTDSNLEDLRPKFRIGFDAPKISHRQILLGIDERATNRVDWGFDAEIYEVFADDMFWVLEGNKYVIQGTNAIGLNSELPLGIQLSKTGMVTVKIDALENVDDDTSIYLNDKLTGESFNMRAKPVQLNLVAGKYADRFVLIFKMQKLVAEDISTEVLIAAAAQPIVEGIHVFMNNDIGELQIKNNSTEEILSVALVNTLGQTIKTWNSNFNIRTISLPLSTATGVYLVQITTKTGNTVKKISVE